jgi:monoamine oxidase
MREVMIVGGGLSGLSAAYYLNKRGIKALVIEARERWGGRILTVPGRGNATPLEMGATWFTDNHPHLKSLLQELGLPFYTQFQKGVGVIEQSLSDAAQLFQIPGAMEPSYRIAGGSSKLPEALLERIGKEQLILGSPVVQVSDHRDHLEIKTSKGDTFACSKLIMTIPPYLIRSQRIKFDPVLPADLALVMEHTHTWMGEAIKFAVEYKQPFWRQQGYAGVVFSQVGVAQEVHDHCNFEENRFALKGFLASEAVALSREKREAKVIAQLGRLIGKEATNYLSYTEKVWKEDACTFADYTKNVMPHQNNGHPLYAKPLMNGKLFLAGTETSPSFGGYLEGAVYSGLAAAKRIQQ